MSWASENKFLTGFGIVMLAGVGTLGYLTYSAMGKYETAYGEYESSSAELRRFQEMKPYPDDKGLKELTAQKQALGEKLAALQKDLLGRALKLEPIKKEAFQDKLKETVARVAAKAAEAKVKFPDNFYMGCAEYQAKPPEEEVAPALARQLRAMELVVQMLLNAGNIEVKELKREPVHGEKADAKSADAAPAPAKGRGAGAGRDKAPRKLVEKTGFTLKFSSTDKEFRQVLNNIVGNKEQVFVVRRMQVKNSAAEPPPKLADAGFPPGAPAAPAAPAAADAPAPPAPAAAPAKTQGSLEYKFGRETIDATLEIEILDFAEPEAGKEKGGNRRQK